MDSLSREDYGDEESLTCPSCRISIIASRPRSMCPFCGSFYDPNAEDDVSVRGVGSPSQSMAALQPAHEEALRLPRIHNVPSNRVLSVAGFTPLITDGLGVIHTYITGLLFRPPATPSDTDFYLTLPPIAGTSHNMDDNNYCRSHGLKPNSGLEASAMLSQRTSPVQSVSQSEEIIFPKRDKTVQEFKEQVREATVSGDYSSVHDFYQRTFSSPIEMCALFKRHTDHRTAKINDAEVKKELLDSVHDHMDDLPSFIGKSVLKGIVSILSGNQRTYPKDDTRICFMLLQNPIFGYQSSYNVFAYLLKRSVNLPSSDHQLLIHWFSRTEPDRFRMLVKRLLQFITIREFPPANGHKLPSISKSRWWIPCATRVLALLNAANNRNNPNLITYTEFYNSALDHINLMSEYYKWQNPSRNNRYRETQYREKEQVERKSSLCEQKKKGKGEKRAKH
ncbi:putative E3 ubiquitin-protein ligase HECTD2 [Halotydeus destructor]|nr:putative E3 ubiquitin-protein ligase HECTD2 [Halotydeus destructor]